MEREVSRRKEKETELLGFSEKLSSSNAQLTADKGMLEVQVSSLEETMTRSTEELNMIKKIKEELVWTIQVSVITGQVQSVRGGLHMIERGLHMIASTFINSVICRKVNFQNYK